MKLSVIVPVYNRKENLRLCLRALLAQKDAPDFELIVVDDGSTDVDVKRLIQDELSWAGVRLVGGLRHTTSSSWIFTRKEPLWNVTVRYLSGGPNKGFRGGRARNIGAFNAEGERFVFVDSDVVLNQDALFHYAYAHEELPNVVIAGPYHWLPPLAIKDDNEHFLWEAKDMPDIIGNILVSGVDRDSPFGRDVRGEGFTDDLTQLGKGAGLGGLSGNISYPRALFLQVGGFDERIIGHGGEDADLGMTVDKYEADWLFYAPVVGFHLWHARDQERNSKEVQANIQFIDRKHGVGTYANAKKWTDSQDWSDPGHFHRHLGAEVVKIDDDPTVWAVRDGRRLGISSVDWLMRLGFSFDNVKVIPPERLNEFQIVGSTPDTTVEDALSRIQVEETRP